MHRDDRSAGAEVGITDQGIELASSLYQPFVDLPQLLSLLPVVGRIALAGQVRAPFCP
ncbi:MAG: hypothetical protein M3280_10930 [Actinomycetota bacterium]|nr:hypothetical protein [Actinomycetota bacterium]